MKGRLGVRVRLNSNHRGAGKAPRRLVLRGNPAPAGGQAEDESDEGGKRPGESESHGNQGEGNVRKEGGYKRIPKTKQENRLDNPMENRGHQQVTHAGEIRMAHRQGKGASSHS